MSKLLVFQADGMEVSFGDAEKIGALTLAAKVRNVSAFMTMPWRVQSAIRSEMIASSSRSNPATPGSTEEKGDGAWGAVTPSPVTGAGGKDGYTGIELVAVGETAWPEQSRDISTTAWRSHRWDTDSDGAEPNVTEGSISPEGRDLATSPSETGRAASTTGGHAASGRSTATVVDAFATGAHGVGRIGVRANSGTETAQGPQQKMPQFVSNCAGAPQQSQIDRV